MPRAFVTGGTGFVGLNLIQELRSRGWDVTASHRPHSNLEYVRRFSPRLVVADLLDREALAVAMPERPDAVFHLAASVKFWPPLHAAQERTNVLGTRHAVEVALERKARRFIHMSSLAAWGPEDGDIIDETTPSKGPAHRVHYFRTKWLGEQEVERGIARGLSATIVNPGNILGPYDPNTWSRVFALAKRGRLPLLPPGGAPFSHVRQVVAATVAAVEQGGEGERYVLGGTQASYREVFELIFQRLGLTPPPVVPAWLFAAAARLSDWASRVTRNEPDVTPELARVLCMRFEARSAKAERELGFEQVPLSRMVEDTYEWLCAEQLA